VQGNIVYPLKSKIKAMTILRYRILLRKEDDGTYTAVVPSLPGCLTFGHTVEEALEMAKEAIEGFIECMIARGEEVPVETEEAMICTVAVGANAETALYLPGNSKYLFGIRHRQG